MVRQIELAAIEHDQAHRGIEMRAGDGREDGDDDEQHRAGGDGVAEQRERLITAGELLGHDAGADHGHDQNQRAERFRREPPRQIELHVPPFLTLSQPSWIEAVSNNRCSILAGAALVANGIDVPQPGKIP